MSAKILVVDDDIPLTRTLQHILESAGYDMQAAYTAEDGLQLALTEQPDLVLLDVMMPGGIDGFEVARRMRNSDVIGRCPIVFITAKVQEKDREMAFAVGGDAFIAKPFSLEMLRETVEEYIGPAEH